MGGLEEEILEQFGLTVDCYFEGLIQLHAALESRFLAVLEEIDPQGTGIIDFDNVKTFAFFRELCTSKTGNTMR